MRGESKIVKMLGGGVIKTKILIMAVLLGICCFITYYFHVILETGALFSHFFYIPIILAALWWGRKSLVVAIFLAALLVFSHFFIRPSVGTVNDLIRALMFIFIALTVSFLREKVAKVEKEQIGRLEKMVDERTKELMGEKNYTRHLIESSPDFQMTLDKNGRIMDVNRAFEKIVGKSHKDVIGMSIYEYLPKEETEKAIAGIFEKKKVRNIEITAKIPGKGDLICNFSGTVFTTLEGEKGIYASGRDITERKKAEEEIHHAAVYTRSLIEASLDPLVTIGPDGKIIDVNESTEKVTGRTRKELIGSDFSDYFTEPAKAKEGYEQVFEKGVVRDYPLEIRHKNGGMTSVLYNASVYEDESGKVIGVFAAARDITERKKAEEEIKQQNIQLRRLNRIKSEFLNVTSHELRTPMTAMKGYIQMLLNQRLGGLTDEQQKALDIVLQNTNRLDNLIQDILDTSLLESGSMKLSPEKTDMNKLMKEIAETMQPSADIKEITINLDMKEGVPELVIDQDRIKQVMINLVNNAIKFSADESVINVRAKKQEENVLVEIQDYGKGIPKDKQKKVFEMFYQVDSGMDRSFGGTGLGLSISRGIVLGHGGKIWVESEKGKGSIFRFMLPIKPIQDVEGTFEEIDMFNVETDKEKSKGE